ncbi:hypothetical protein BLW95_00170 [Lacticaseibacillus paracasei]|nr:hypothetical protein BLW95_00170 [Lacticaseibacillus paracasei]
MVILLLLILDDIFDFVRSILNRFVKMIWIKGGREKVGNEVRSYFESVRNYILCLFFFLSLVLIYNNLIYVG